MWDQEIRAIGKYIVYSLWFIVNYILSSCGDNASITRKGEPGDSCTVIKQDNSTIITCPDGSVAEIFDGIPGQNGTDGINGTDGENGKDGKSYKTEPVYIGYYCSRNVLRISNKYYILNSNLVLLSTAWYPVSSSCKVRRYNGNIEVM